MQYNDIINYIHILKNINDLLPMPIAEEIIPNIHGEYSKYVKYRYPINFIYKSLENI